MQNSIKAFLCMLTFIYGISNATSQVRETIRIPDIPGYITMTYDPHIHTVFSDGTVWPTVRVNEAWQEGLDIISITDHIEYRPFRSDVTGDHNRAYEIARPIADRMGIMLIHGAEITRPMPPGHFNALFIDDANKLETETWQDAIGAAREQGGFHPMESSGMGQTAARHHSLVG
jgi:3',5'-nucleoside bisphosphate phosphatase